MPQYKFKAKDRNGNTIEEVLEASDDRVAASILRERGLYPMDISLVRGTAESSAPNSSQPRQSFGQMLLNPFYTGVNIRSLVLCFTQMTTMLKAGMSLSEILNGMGTRTTGRLGKILMEALEHVRSGGRLSETLERHPSVFNNLITSLIKAGESGGLLDTMVERIAQNLEFEIRIRRAYSRVLFYPYVILFFIILTPHIPVLFLGTAAQFFASLWHSLRYWVPGLAVGFVAIKFFMQFHGVRRAWDAVKVLPPIVGTAADKVAQSRFARAMASLYRAGLPMTEVLRVSADACGNLAMADRLKPAVAAIASGKNFTQSVAMTGALPPMVLDMLSVGERTGNYEDVLEKVADHLEAEAEISFTKASIILFVLCILGAAIVVGLMAAKFYGGAAMGAMNAGDM